MTSGNGQRMHALRARQDGAATRYTLLSSQYSIPDAWAAPEPPGPPETPTNEPPRQCLWARVPLFNTAPIVGVSGTPLPFPSFLLFFSSEELVLA